MIIVDVVGDETVGESGGDVGAYVVKLGGAGVGVAVLGGAAAEGWGAGVGTGRFEGAKERRSRWDVTLWVVVVEI